MKRHILPVGIGAYGFSRLLSYPGGLNYNFYAKGSNAHVKEAFQKAAMEVAQLRAIRDDKMMKNFRDFIGALLAVGAYELALDLWDKYQQKKAEAQGEE